MQEQDFFSPKAVDLRNRIKGETDRGKRETLMVELAEEALSTHDVTDAELSDEYHQFFEELEISKSNYRSAALKVARLVIDGLDSIGQAGTESVGPKVYPPHMN